MRHQKFGLATIVVTVAVFLVAIAFEHWADHSLVAPLKTILSLVLVVVEGGLLLWSLYQVVVSLAGLMPTRLCLHTGFVHPRILCITTAHNEEAVIAEHIKSLQQMTYPSKGFDIAILADNCTDDTARIARRTGVKVWERTNDTLKGKGQVLRWAFENRVSLLKYDGVCIFDADNLVDPNFLHVMASHLNRGDVAIQAYLDTKNPWDSWITATYASAYWFMNRLWQRSRAMLGLSGAIGGTGFCVSTRILERMLLYLGQSVFVRTKGSLGCRRPRRILIGHSTYLRPSAGVGALDHGGLTELLSTCPENSDRNFCYRGCQRDPDDITRMNAHQPHREYRVTPGEIRPR